MPVLSQFGLPGPSLLAVKLRGLRTSFFSTLPGHSDRGPRPESRKRAAARIANNKSGAGEDLGQAEQRRNGKGGRGLFPEQVRDGDGGGASGVLGE